MTERSPEIQAIRLARFLLMPWPEGWGLKKIDGIWHLLPLGERHDR